MCFVYIIYVWGKCITIYYDGSYACLIAFRLWAECIIYIYSSYTYLITFSGPERFCSWTERLVLPRQGLEEAHKLLVGIRSTLGEFHPSPFDAGSVSDSSAQCFCGLEGKAAVQTHMRWCLDHCPINNRFTLLELQLIADVMLCASLWYPLVP